MSVSLETVKELREKTNAGMMDCKRALEEAKGDIDGAVDYLRKKGLATAAKKAGRAAAEGTIADRTSNDGKTHVLVEVNCETDFVVKTDDFQKFASNVADIVINKQLSDLEKLMAHSLEGKTVKDVQTDLVAKIGENINVRRLEIVTAGSGEKIAKYIHPGSKIGVLVRFDDPNGKLSDQLAKEVAMHVAAMNPMYVGKEDISKEYIEKEKEIFKGQLADTKKPPEILEKIIMGKLSKQLSEVCLEDQVFVKAEDGKTSVKNTLKKADSGIKIKAFTRFQVGEGIEKKKSDLGAEVAEMIK